MPSSDYLDQLVLARLFNGGAMPTFSNVYAALYNVAPTKTGGGTEVATGGYGRIAVPSTSAFWALTGPTYQVVNIEVINFGVATGAPWGSLAAFGLFDALTAGNLLFFATFGAPVQVDEGDPVVFNPSQLTVTGT